MELAGIEPAASGLQNREVEPIPKAGLSSDCRLQLAYMKPELLVTARQH
jgi:hypothetical protein